MQSEVHETRRLEERVACVLCSIADDEGHRHRIAADADTVTMLNNHPAVPGHVVVLPRQHAPDAWDCPPTLYGAVYAAVQEATLLLRDRLDADGVTVVEAVRGAGWQSIPHLHVHVLPRHEDDGLPPIWSSAIPATEHDLADMRARLTAPT